MTLNESTALLLLLALFMSFAALVRAISNPSDAETDRRKMTNDILEIEKILHLSNSHYLSELNLMREDELSKLYRDLREEFNLYIEKRNSEQNRQALEDF